MYTRDGPIRAVVQGVYPSKHSSVYCVAKADGIEGSVTFSLEPTVWMEREFPEAGEVVLLEDLRNKRAGWRAKKGRFWRPSDEHQATRKEQKMDIKERLSNIVCFSGSRFTPAQEKTWRRWVDLQDRTNTDLANILSNPKIDKAFKSAALMVLFTPSSEQDQPPVYWTDRYGAGFTGHWWRLGGGKDILNYLSSELIAFGARVVAMNMHELKGTNVRSRQYIFQKLNDIVPDLLAKLPVASVEAEGCFREFSLREVVPPYCDESFASGYQPFYNLLADKSVSDVWKIRADADMRDQILAELSGSATPRAEWENALDWYRRTLSQLGGDGVYGVELLADQLSFYLSLSDLRTKSQYHIFPERAYGVLGDGRFRHLRYLLAQYAAFVEPGFLVYDSKSAGMAEAVVGEFTEDGELVGLYASELAKWKVESAGRIQKDEKEKGGKAREEEEVLDVMRS